MCEICGIEEEENVQAYEYVYQPAPSLFDSTGWVYVDALDAVLDVIEAEASIEPITPRTYETLARTILEALQDA